MEEEEKIYILRKIISYFKQNSIILQTEKLRNNGAIIP